MEDFNTEQVVCFLAKDNGFFLYNEKEKQETSLVNIEDYENCKVKIIYPDQNMCYIGKIDCKGKPSGEGEMQYKDELCRYEGSWFDGKRQKGKITCEDGIKYETNFNDDRISCDDMVIERWITRYFFFQLQCKYNNGECKEFSVPSGTSGLMYQEWLAPYQTEKEIEADKKRLEEYKKKPREKPEDLIKSVNSIEKKIQECNKKYNSFVEKLSNRKSVKISSNEKNFKEQKKSTDDWVDISEKEAKDILGKFDGYDVEFICKIGEDGTKEFYLQPRKGKNLSQPILMETINNIMLKDAIVSIVYEKEGEWIKSYCGEVDENMEPNGEGIMACQENKDYICNFKNGLMDGEVTIIDDKELKCRKTFFKDGKEVEKPKDKEIFSSKDIQNNSDQSKEDINKEKDNNKNI